MEKLVEQLMDFNLDDFKPDFISKFLNENAHSLLIADAYKHFNKEHYMRNLICKNDNFEMLFLCWEPGQNTPIHDHASQSCWMFVIEGLIISENYFYVAPKDFDGTLEKMNLTSFKKGEAYYIDDSDSLHLLKNPEKFNSKATTLHIYSKPFSSCSIYDLEKKKTHSLTLNYDSMGGNLGSYPSSEILFFK